jgi:type I restriction enzyme S subunit
MGIIPDDWVETHIGASNPFITSGSRGWARYYAERGDVFVRITNMSRDSIRLNLDDLCFVSLPDIGHEGNRTRLRSDDVLISVTADIGIICLIDKRVPTPAYINQHIALIRFSSSELSPAFIALFLAHYPAQRRFRAITDQGAKAGINLVTVRAIPFAMPPTKLEQVAVATAVQDLDELLSGLDRLIAKKRDLKLAAMQQLLTGQTRLPGFSSEWAEKTFAELFAFSGGYSASRDQLSTQGHCYLHYGDIHGSTKTFIDASADALEIPRIDIPLSRVSSNSLLEDGDVVFVDASEDDEGASRHVVVVNKAGVPFISGLHTIVAKSKTDELAHEYRRYCFQTAAVRKQFLFYTVGTKVSGISKTNVAKIRIPFPSVPEQTAIAAVLSDMDAELAALESRRDKTRGLKQAMMQELLTGKTRLVEASPTVDAIEVDAETKSVPKARPTDGRHNWQINEAVVIGVLAKRFGSEKWPLPRKRRIKLTYLLHRHYEGVAEGFLKKAAGPYDPRIKYQGPEKIAIKNGYVREHHNGTCAGFVSGDGVDQATGYFSKWYGDDSLEWLERFHYEKTDELELLTTVDMAMVDLKGSGREVNLETAKSVIRDHPEWEAKLERDIFSDANIVRAIARCLELFA